MNTYIHIDIYAEMCVQICMNIDVCEYLHTYAHVEYKYTQPARPYESCKNI